MEKLDKHQIVVDQLYELLKQVITPKTEIHFMKAFISQLVVNNVEETETEYIMRAFYNRLITGENYNSHESNTTWEFYEDYMDELYYEKIGSERPNAGINGLYVWLKTIDTGNLNVKKLIESINEIFEPLNNSQSFSMEIGSDKYIELDAKNKTVQLLNMKTTRRGGDKSTYEIIINAYPKEVIVHNNPLDNCGRTFTIKWVSKTSSRPFKNEKSTIKEIEHSLEDEGWVLNPRLMKGTIAAIINIAIENDFAEVRNTIENPGFYYDEESEKLIKVNFDINKSTKDSLKLAIDTLDELVGYFPNQEVKLSTCIKWGLVAPFNYAKKQMNGDYIPWLYLYGKGGSGKTTMGEMLLYLWQIPIAKVNNIGGSSFDTEARTGENLSRSTFPILINEPEGAFQKTSVMALIKSAIESTVARGKFENGRYRTIPSFAPVMISANVFLPNEDAILRRFEILLFTHNEFKDADVTEKFNSAFNIGNHKKCRLLNLRGFADYFYEEIFDNPKLLELNWKELADQLIVRAYREVGLKTPRWLLKWNVSATLKDHDDEQIEEIRMFLIDEINRATKKVQVWDESTGRPNLEVLGDSGDDVKTAYDFDSRVWNVLNENLIPWIGLKYNSKSDRNEVYFTTGMKKHLNKYAEISDNLLSISQLLGWEYKPVRLPKVTTVMVVDYEEFLKFLYPTVVDDI